MAVGVTLNVGFSITMLVECGVPQGSGSIIGLILFIMYTKYLPFNPS